MTDKLIFIDIDGCVMRYHESSIKDRAREALKALKDAGWKLILHSTWRANMLAEAYQLFADAGCWLDGHCQPKEPSKVAAVARYMMDNHSGCHVRCVVIDDWIIEPIPGVEFIHVPNGLTIEDVRGLL